MLSPRHSVAETDVTGEPHVTRLSTHLKKSELRELQERRARRKANASPLPSTLEYMCTVYGRVCKSKIGLASHNHNTTIN